MLEPFRRYLSENARIKVKYIPYYLKWISECYSYINRSIEQHISSEQKQQFLSHMSRSHEDWQVKQADYALRLYNFFLSRHREEFSHDSANFKNEWKMIEDIKQEISSITQAISPFLLPMISSLGEIEVET